MPGPLFAQSLVEYVSLAGFVTQVQQMWSTVLLRVNRVDDTTWVGIAVAAAVLLFILRGRR